MSVQAHPFLLEGGGLPSGCDSKVWQIGESVLGLRVPSMSLVSLVALQPGVHKWGRSRAREQKITCSNRKGRGGGERRQEGEGERLEEDRGEDKMGGGGNQRGKEKRNS